MPYNTQQELAAASNRVDVQIATERYYDKRNIDERLDFEIDIEPEIQEVMFKATMDIMAWATDFEGYESKRERLDLLLEHNDIGHIVREGMKAVLSFDDRVDFIVSHCAMLKSHIRGMDKHSLCSDDATQERRLQMITAGEILTMMCDADCFDMKQLTRIIEDEETGEEYETKSWAIENPWELSESTTNAIKRGMYMPPLIVKPKKLTKNDESVYLTVEHDKRILGKKTYHDGDVCLDIINKFNSVPLAINVEFIKSVDVLMQDEDADMSEEAYEQYQTFMEKTYQVFAYLYKNGNRWYLDHKPDQRGRIYCQGYHASYQGNAFRKSAIELANKHVVTGDL